MSVLLTCDAPGCSATTLPVVKLNKPAPPDGWWMQCIAGNRIICACSNDHLVVAAKASPV